MTESSSRSKRPERSPAPVRTVIILMVILAIGLLLIALDNIAADSTGPSGENLGIAPLLFSGLLGWIARGLGQRRRGSRIVTCVIFGFLPLGGLGIIRSDPSGAGLFGLLPLGLGVLVIWLLTGPPSSREWFARPETVPSSATHPSSAGHETDG